MAAGKKRILVLCHEIIQPWTSRDISLLRKHFDVDVLTFHQVSLSRRGTFFLFRFVSYLVTRCLDVVRLAAKIPRADIIFGWFASEFVVMGVLIGKAFRKPSIIVTGGYDIENMPEINYGLARHASARFIVRAGLEATDYVLPFSDYTAKKVKDLTRNVRHLKVVNLACDTHKFKPSVPKENIVITAGFIDAVYVRRKGFDTFVKAAHYLPDVQFYLIGKQRDKAIEELRRNASPNVVFTGFLSDEELLMMYQRAKVFCLLSYQEGEGGGGVLGEAMACGCYPVVSSSAVALEETVGECGMYVPYGDVHATADAIAKALAMPANHIPKTRERIEELYSLEKRETNLLNIIHEIDKT